MKIWKICYILYNSYTVTTQTSFFLKSVRSDWNLEVENNSTLTKNVAEFSLEQMKTVLSFIPLMSCHWPNSPICKQKNLTGELNVSKGNSF